MDHIFIILLLTFSLCFVQSQQFPEESSYLAIRLMDIKIHELKPDLINKIEKVLDSDLKYIDEKKSIACKSIYFEQDVNSPTQDGRFLDLSIRGMCLDAQGQQHIIDKDLMTNAIIRKTDQVNAITHATLFRIGNVQLYTRIRNQLNAIIIPVSIGFVSFLFILTFSLRQMRAKQKRQHIIMELQKRKGATTKKAPVIPNIDPLANDKQRLLQLDPTVVGNVSDTMGSPKEFTMEQYSSPIRFNTKTAADNRYYQGTSFPPVVPSKENRTAYANRDNETSFQTQRPLKSSRENMHIQYEKEPHVSSNHSQYQYEPQYPDMISMQEQNPRVVVRSIRDDANYPAYHQPQQYEDTSQKFVSIPVQVEQSSSYQRFVSPPYHSDPYYPQTNS
ncbi:unnamed protein product [Rotaria magnacalcarata]|uniref:Uncharacterized protein n=5 Tax=Rotaria magnacalcarata TaxID=392030 RepID=A0A814Z7N8_9BILA|nr:unnamed protein product [Rotaria magnacalcarata]CAF1482596.1 unnamed protein product [Rotaria magnacalcarata]CAF2072193.1 unnamed protein product [Rotaria magnacalcarata]CAF2093787.1 unnamed protein product [Rotaria magnacalcarata]CAF3734392.1 unnamed protein product [Rotaria magnacalcarata]